MHGRKNREGGFTLIEILIAVAILSIGATLAIPSYLSWNSRYQLREAITTIQSNLMLARMAAMNRNKVVNVNFTLASGQVTISSLDASSVSVLPPATMMAHVTAVEVANSAGTTKRTRPPGRTLGRQTWTSGRDASSRAASN